MPRDVRDWHPAIDRLLKEDKERREQQLASGYSWDAPLFETPLERRRLHILNTLFLAAARMNGNPALMALANFDDYEGYIIGEGAVPPGRHTVQDCLL